MYLHRDNWSFVFEVNNSLTARSVSRQVRNGLKKDDHPGYIRSNPLKEDRQDLEIDQVTPDDLDKLYSHDVQPQQRNPQFPQVNKYTYIVDSFMFFMIVIYFFIRWKKVFLYKVEKDFNFWKMLVFKVS